MLARVNSVQTAPEKLAGLLKFAGERLPDAREAPRVQGLATCLQTVGAASS